MSATFRLAIAGDANTLYNFAGTTMPISLAQVYHGISSNKTKTLLERYELRRS